MNAKQLIASVALLAATGAVFAQAAEYEVPNANFVSTKTRAEVVAELKQARTAGTFVAGGEVYSGDRVIMAQTARPQNAPAVATGKTRAEVIAELQQAKAEGRFVAGGTEFPNDAPVMAKNLRNRGEAIESAGSKAAPKANGG
jgi:uncharacterized protein YciI